MDFDGYQELARMTGNTTITTREKQANYSLGLGEAGEIQDVVKKWLYHGQDFPTTVVGFVDEAGDLLWYITMLAETFGVSLREIAEHNIRKLKARYPDGFSKEASKNRKVRGFLRNFRGNT